MNLPDAPFAHRLERSPSASFELASNAVITASCVLVSAILFLAVRRAGAIPAGFWWMVFGGSAFIALDKVWDLTWSIWRLITGREPVVEVERLPWRPGEGQRIRVIDPDVVGLESFQVLLEADNPIVNTGGKPRKSGVYRNGILSKVKHASTLFTASGSDLDTLNSGLDVVARASVPTEAMGMSWRWGIRVLCCTPGGAARDYWFPLPVDAREVTHRMVS
jgi:hypothetical protein